MRAWIALALIVPALAGCLADEPTADYRSRFDHDARGVALPDCALVPGDIDWSVYAPAPPPSLPVEATIKRDAYGVPHIYADDDYALFYATGYAQAQDRLFMMDVLRLVGYGESARYLGPSQLASDIEVRRDLYTAEEIDAMWQAAPDSSKQVLQAYADGVNRYMAEMVLRNELPGEFAAVGRIPVPWTPQDSVAVIIYLIGYFGVDGGKELSNLQTLGRLQETVGDDAWAAFGDLAWTRVDDSYTSIAPEDRIINGCEDPLAEPPAFQVDAAAAAIDAVPFGIPTEGLPIDLERFLPPPEYSPERGSGLFSGFKWGSNALLVDGTITDTGRPIMWGAPQMGYYKPPVPYQLGLHGAGFDAAGIGVTGAPGMVIGRNADIAWSATSGFEDQIDVVQLSLTGARSYDWDGTSHAMDCWTSVHQLFPAPQDLAAFPAVDLPTTWEQEICRAHGMPVVAINEAAGIAWATRTTTRGEELMGALKWLQAPFASSIEEFQATMADFPFTFNFHVASADDVALLHTGNIPIRADGIDVRLPTPAGSAHEWQAEVYTEGMGTFLTDPSSGYVANWNNAPAVGWRAGDAAYQWGPVHRVQQIEWQMQEALAHDGTISFDDVKAINHRAATHDSLALPVIAAMADLVGTEDPNMALLDEWAARGAPWADADGDGLYDDQAHAVWDHVFVDLIARIQGDELGDRAAAPDLDPLTHSDPHAGDHGTATNKLSVVLKALQGKTQHDWCDDIRTDAHETCEEQVRASLAGASPSHLPLHYSGFTSIGGAVADQRPMLNKGSWVQVVSMAEPERSVSAMPPANSARLNTIELALLIGAGLEPERLTSELDLYWTGQFKPFPLTPSEVDEQMGSEETLIVLPPLL